MTANYPFESATEQDAEAIAQLVNEAYRTPQGWTNEAAIVSGNRCDKSQVLTLIHDKDSEILIIRQDKKIIACIHLLFRGRKIYFGLFAVHPDWQANGLGKKLLTSAEHYAMQKYSAECFVMLVVKQRPELIAYYQRQGYEMQGNELPYPKNENVGTPKASELTIINLVKNSTIWN